MIPRPALRRLQALFAALLLALVLVPTLGAMHRVAHAGEADGTGWVDRLFAGHHQDGDCGLYDQLTHGDALCAPPLLAIPTLPPDTPARVHATWHFAAQAAGFLARGPPALS